MIMKQCIKCKEEKELIEFGKDNQNKDGFKNYCKICKIAYNIQYQLNNKEKIKENKKEYYLNNKEKIYEIQKEYYENNKEKFKEYRFNNKDKKKEYQKEYQKEYKLNNKEKLNSYYNKYCEKRRLTDPLFKLRSNISTLILRSIKGNGYTKKSKSHKILGCSFEYFKHHLEKQFTKGMNWENQGQWHMDHIYPISLAKDEEELIRLNHYTNFQPLWAIDNIKKGNKIIEKQLILI